MNTFFFLVDRAKKHSEDRDDTVGIGDNDSIIGEFPEILLLLLFLIPKVCVSYDLTKIWFIALNFVLIWSKSKLRGFFGLGKEMFDKV